MGSPALYKVGIVIYHIPFFNDKKHVRRRKPNMNSWEIYIYIKGMPKILNNIHFLRII